MMKHICIPSSPPFQPLPLLSLLDIRRAALSRASRTESVHSSMYTIWWVRHSHANIEIDGQTYRLGSGSGALVPPDSVAGLAAADPDDGEAEAYLVQFAANEAAAALLGREPRIFAASTACHAGFIALLEQWGVVEGAAALRMHARFQEWVSALLELEQRAASASFDAEQGVRETIQYMHREYASDIRIDSLAERTALSRVKYNDVFKSMTGKTPVQYLTDLRIERAKQLLLASGYRLKDIAEQSGFRDEYYFSRRFKQAVGISPTGFVRLQSKDARICSLHMLGDLLSLGILPVGANRSLADLYSEETQQMHLLAEPLNTDELQALQPDLIVSLNYVPRAHYVRLNAIAPIALLDWNDDIYTRLAKLGRLLDRGFKAAAWIEAYRDKARSVRRQLRPYVRQGESASAFVYHRNALFVYGGHNFGHTLYEGIGFAPPDRIRMLMTKKKPLKWKQILPQDMPRYAGDRVFMAVGAEDRSSRAFLDIVNSEAWNRLTAVRNQRSYIVEQRWGVYDTLTLERHLDEMLLLLTT